MHMDIKKKLFQQLILFADEHLSHLNHFMCVYGSYASESYNDKSDVDLFVAAEKHDIIDSIKICNFIINLHMCNNLVFDNEVPYENKLFVSYEDIEAAINLKSFVKKRE